MARREKNVKYKFKFTVLGEGITEQCYLTHLKELKGYKYSIRPILFKDIGIEDAEEIIDELLSGGCDQIVFFTDCDTIVNQNKQECFKQFVDKYKERDEVLICDNMPSIEYWFLLHFIYTTKEFANCEEVVRDLKNHITDYEKKKSYLEKDKWFKKLIKDGGLDKAIEYALKGLNDYENGDVGSHFPYSKLPIALSIFEEQKKQDL